MTSDLLSVQSQNNTAGSQLMRETYSSSCPPPITHLW